jgi:hypothetical protein
MNGPGDREPMTGRSAAVAALGAALVAGTPGRALVGAGLVAAPIVAAGIPAGRYLSAWHTVHDLCVRHRLYDAPYQAKAKREYPHAGVSLPRGRGATLPPGRATPLGRPRSFTVWTAIGLPSVDLDGWLADVNHYLAPEVYTCHRVPGGRRLELAVAPPLPSAPPDYPVEATLDPDDDDPATFPIGVTRTGPAAWTAGDLMPHLLVAAPPGWGKSHLVNLVLFHAARFPEWWETRIIDPEGELDDWRDVPGVRAVAGTVAEQLTLVRELTLELELRTLARTLAGVPYAEQIARGATLELDQAHGPVPAGTHHIKPGRRLLIIDELATVMSRPRQGEPNYAERRELQAGLLDYLWRGRKRGFHAVGATTDPRADVITGSLRDPFRARIAGGYTNRGPWSVMFDEQPPRTQEARHGLGWLRVEGAELLEVQVHGRPDGLEALLTGHNTATPPTPATPSVAPSRPDDSPTRPSGPPASAGAPASDPPGSGARQGVGSGAQPRPRRVREVTEGDIPTTDGGENHPEITPETPDETS